MVGYAFSHQEINSSTWVYRNLVAAGAFNNLDWESDDHSAKSHKKEFRIFHQTKSYPRAIELVRGNLDPKIKSRLKSVLLNAHLDPDAASALKSYQRTTRFDEMNALSLAGMEEIRRLMHLIKEKLE
jgi:phosphonate transport system substrate-binding protein